MRVVLQRVSAASVSVGGAELASIGVGLLVLVGVERGDTSTDVDRAAAKIAGVRLFGDPAGKMNLALADVSGSVLAVSQFTLAGSIAKGRRPGFDGAMEPVAARSRFDELVAAIRAQGLPVMTGAFGEHMEVRLVNDGPVTFVYETGRT